MLADLITTIVTPVSPSLRALGYLGETLAMRRRARANRTAWQPHLDRTRSFIRSAAARCGGGRKVVVLGSGLLLDVPLGDLADAFEQVVLQDVVCLPDVRNRIRSYRNVAFVEHDVTGIAEQLHHAGRRDLRALPEVRIPEPGTDSDADLIISLNILSQLWVVPRAFIGQRHGHLAPEQVDDWCARIVEVHAQWLRSRSCDVCLVADREAVMRDRSGGIVSRTSTIYGLVLPDPEDTWTWNIAPLGRHNPHTSKELLVGAWRFPARS